MHIDTTLADVQQDTKFRDLTREREDAVSVARGIIISVLVAVFIWGGVVFTTWHIATALSHALS